MIRTLLLGLLMATSAVGHAAQRTLTIFAAASLSDVLQEIGNAYTARTQQAVRFSFAASSALAKQIESGAPADVFISADEEWMDYLAARKLINLSTRRDVVSNSLVLVAPADSKLQLRIAPGVALAAALGKKGRLATGDPASVPVGKYAKAALTSRGAWKEVESRLVPADNVRTALNFVARGEVPLGIVYATDARVDPHVRIVDTFPANSHARIAYPAAATARAQADAQAFVTFLGGDAARAAFDRAGFSR